MSVMGCKKTERKKRVVFQTFSHWASNKLSDVFIHEQHMTKRLLEIFSTAQHLRLMVIRSAMVGQCHKNNSHHQISVAFRAALSSGPLIFLKMIKQNFVFLYGDSKCIYKIWLTNEAALFSRSLVQYWLSRNQADEDLF